MPHATANMKNWEGKLKAMSKQAHTQPVFVLWTATPKDEQKPPTTWCPDCNRACPAIREAATKHGAYLLEVEAGTAEEYKSSSHFLRTAPEYQPFKDGIPKLAAYSSSSTLKAQTGAELANAKSHEAALEVAEAFIKEQSLDGMANPLACPYVQTGIAVGIVVLGAAAAAVYVLQKKRK